MKKKFDFLQTLEPELITAIKIPDSSLMSSFLQNHPCGHLQVKSHKSPVVERRFNSIEDIKVLFPGKNTQLYD